MDIDFTHFDHLGTPYHGVTSWSLHQEQQFIRDVVRAFAAPDEWGSKVRDRHGSVNQFLRSYLKALDVRVRAFESNGDHRMLIDAERWAMRSFCERLMITETGREEERIQ